RAMGVELTQTFLKPHDQDEMGQRAEARCRSAWPPHIEDGAALNTSAGSNPSFIGYTRNNCHPLESMGQAAANALHPSNDSGKDLSASSGLNSLLADSGNAGMAPGPARRSGVELCLVNRAIRQHEPHQSFPVHFQHPGLVAMRVAQVDLADGKVCDFKTHRVHQCYENVSAHVK